MKTGKFIAFEGIDASGKSTQISLLAEWLSAAGMTCERLKFPRVDDSGFGQAIASFLRGEYGSVESTHPMIVAALFAADRLAASASITRLLASNDVLLVDRYVHSNVAFQSAKLESQDAKNRIAAWILDTEFRQCRLPKPDLVLYLRVPGDFSKAKNAETRIGAERHYLRGGIDIHEQAIDLQEKVAVEYERMARHEPLIQLVNCVSEDGSMLPKHAIAKMIRSLVQPVLNGMTE